MKTILKNKNSLKEFNFAMECEDENLYLKILSNIPYSILIIDSDLRIGFANHNFLVKSRKNKEEVLGRRISEVFPPVIVSYIDIEEKLRRVFHSGKPFDGGEIEYRTPGLARRIYFYSLTPLADNEGQLRNVMFLLDDVTEKKSLGERVTRAEQHLGSVVESANDIIVSMDGLGSIITWNNAAKRVFGFSANEMLKKPFIYLFSEKDQSHIQYLFNLLAKGKDVHETETNMVANDEREVLISWRFSAIKNGGGKIAALVGIGRDLTEKRQLELQLIQSSKMAALGDMAGGIAHELRNPLAITSSAAQILFKKGDDAKLRKECAEKIHSASIRAATIIENLLKFARPSERIPEKVDINTILNDTMSLIENQITLQGIEVIKNFKPELPKVKGNKNQLQQVFMNIALNAYHAMSKGGKFTIGTYANHDSINISFSDTGCGISEKDLARIFDPFFTTAPVGNGIGLGLSIAYSIIKNHNGSIKVKSKLGEGAIFTISFPIDSSAIPTICAKNKGRAGSPDPAAG